MCCCDTHREAHRSSPFTIAHNAYAHERKTTNCTTAKAHTVEMAQANWKLKSSCQLYRSNLCGDPTALTITTHVHSSLTEHHITKNQTNCGCPTALRHPLTDQHHNYLPRKNWTQGNSCTKSYSGQTDGIGEQEEAGRLASAQA